MFYDVTRSHKLLCWWRHSVPQRWSYSQGQTCVSLSSGSSSLTTVSNASAAHDVIRACAWLRRRVQRCMLHALRPLQTSSELGECCTAAIEAFLLYWTIDSLTSVEAGTQLARTHARVHLARKDTDALVAYFVRFKPSKDASRRQIISSRACGESIKNKTGTIKSAL